MDSKRINSRFQILFLSDTHLGFDLPAYPRIDRRRRGYDFQKMYLMTLNEALLGNVQMVIHGGDLFYRSKIKASLVEAAFEPLRTIAQSGIPVILVPGNHERSDFPYGLLTVHPNIYIFRKPDNFCFDINGLQVQISGFPFVRDCIRKKLSGILEQTRYERQKADLRFLCIHQAVDGSIVGAQNYMFRYQSDVIDPTEIPGDFTAVFSGHIHRAQIVRQYLDGKQLRTPVIFAGSIERTSFAERNEIKGYYLINITEDRKIQCRFKPLPARPMTEKRLDLPEMNLTNSIDQLKMMISELPDDAIVRFRFRVSEAGCYFKSDLLNWLKSGIPKTMNYEVYFD